MKNSVKRTLSLVVSLVMLISCFSFSQLTAAAATTDGITAKYAGWFETAYAEWLPVTGAGFYKAYVKSSSGSYEELDDELIRQYDTYVRADAVGLPEGSYTMKIEAYDYEGGNVLYSDEGTVTVSAYDRNGSAFSTKSTHYSQGGIGAYDNDGSLKSDAKVFYVTAENAATITTDVITSSKGSTTTATGLQDIIYYYQKGYDTTPIAFRFIGTVSLDDLDRIDSSSEGIQVKGKTDYSLMPMTFEGIGNDATVNGFGFLVRNAGKVEFRNFAVINFMDDGISLDTSNCNVWVHNMDFFYGNAGSDADQKKGDGTVDIKNDSQFITVSYNHFWDSGKSSLCGMKSESGNNYITYHHNWFDHSDSRHPRVRSMSVHIYNNFFDGNAKYGSASAMSSSLFVESNYFRSCKYPVLIGGQGSEGGNVLSGETGTPIKMYGNIMTGNYTYIDYSSNSSDFDGYTVSSRTETIPDTVTAAGGEYNNFDTEYSDYLGVDEDDITSAANVPTVVMASAGRCNGGDIFWTFEDSEDTNSSVIDDLKTKITDYTTTLRVIGGTVDSDACNYDSTTKSAATGVDGCSTYTTRDSNNKTDGETLAKETDGGSTSSGSSSGSSTTTTGYDLKLTGSDIGDSTISSTTTYTGSGESDEENAFTIYAAEGKTVTINGSQIRLGGAGTFTDGEPVSRIIAVTLSETGTITLNASNGGAEARTLALSKDGSNSLAELEIAAGSSGSTTYEASAGTYYIYSKGSNLYVTLVGVTYSSSASETTTESTTEGETQTAGETVTETTTETTTEAMFFDDGDDDSDYDETTTETTTEAETEAEEDDSSTSSATGSLIWNYTSGENTLGVSFSGSAWGSAKNYPLSYNSETLSAAVKMESSTSFSFTTTADGTQTLIFYSTTSSPTVKIDGTAYSLTSDSSLISDGKGYIETLELDAGSHTVTKGTASTYLYYSSVELENITGDVNYDGNVNDEDAAIVLKIASGVYSEDDFDNADCNNDNSVDVLDAVWILNNQSGSGSGSETTTETAAETTTEGSETTTESSGGSGDSGSTSAVSSTWKAGDSTTPSWLNLGSLTASSNGSSYTAFSTYNNGSAFSYAVDVAADGTFTVTPTSAGTLTVYIAADNNSDNKGTVTAAYNGTTLDSYSLPNRKSSSATPFTITVSEDYVGKEITFTVSYASLLFMIS
ncbi:MAG: hypothetical protein LUD77_11990 [Clostridiales bacterium]|nr:hypothetical protein [Clostridiales bacterium]